MPKPFARIVFTLALVASPLLSPSAHAQSSEPDASRAASARSLFEEGVALAEKADWPGAEDRFRRALSLRDSPVIAYNLASALNELGKLVEASELLRKLEHDDKADAALKQSVTTLEADIAPRIGRITVTVRDQAAADQVKLDGHALLDAQLGVGIPIDPGNHQVSVERGGKELDTQWVEVAASASSEVTLHAVQAPSPAEVAAAAAPAPKPTNEAAVRGGATPITKAWWFWTGVGVAGVATVVLVAVLASSGSGSGQASSGFRGDFNPASLQVKVAP